MQPDSMDTITPSSRGANVKKFMIIAFVLVMIPALYFGFQYLNPEFLVSQEKALNEFKKSNPVVLYGSAFLAYALITGLSLPGAAILTLLYGWYFGIATGLVLVSFASTTGATISFLLSRYFLRSTVEAKFGAQLASFKKQLETEGAFYLFTLRLIPAVPFFVINLVMGLTPIKLRTFWLVSQLGMLPGTLVYVYAGSSVPSLKILVEQGAKAVFTPTQSAQIVIAFAILGLFPLVVRYTMKFFNRSKNMKSDGTEEMEIDRS